MGVGYLLPFYKGITMKISSKEKEYILRRRKILGFRNYMDDGPIADSVEPSSIDEQAAQDEPIRENEFNPNKKLSEEEVIEQEHLAKELVAESFMKFRNMYRQRFITNDELNKFMDKEQTIANDKLHSSVLNKFYNLLGNKIRTILERGFQVN